MEIAYCAQNSKEPGWHFLAQLVGAGCKDAEREGECPPSEVEWKFLQPNNGCHRKEQPYTTK